MGNAAVKAAPLPNTDWNLFSRALTEAVQSPIAGVQHGALQQIARYGDKLTLDDQALFEMIRIYRSDEDDNVRILALSALSKTDNGWVMDFFRRSARFETSRRVLERTLAVVQEYDQKLLFANWPSE